MDKGKPFYWASRLDIRGVWPSNVGYRRGHRPFSGAVWCVARCGRPVALGLFLGLRTNVDTFWLAHRPLRGKACVAFGYGVDGHWFCLCYLSAEAWAVIVSVFLIGTGVTAVQIAGNPFIRVLDQPARYTSNLTLIIGIGALGYALSPLIVPILQANNLSWTTIYLLLAVVNAVIFVVVALANFPKATTNADERLNLGKLFQLCRNPLVLVYALGIFLYVGGEVGVSSYIITFMNNVHHLSNDQSFWPEPTFMHQLFPSKTALIVALFWLLQAVGRLVASALMRRVSERAVFIVHSALTVVALVVAMMGSEGVALVSFAFVGYFTCVSFTAIFSAVINSFNHDHGMLSGILGTAIVGGAFIGWLVGVVGNAHGMVWGMAVNVVAFAYVMAVAVWGKGKHLS